MRILLPILIIMIIFGANGALVLFAFSDIINHTAVAEEYSPLDFIDTYDNFEVTVGIDRKAGRYARYHYEFSE